MLKKLIAIIVGVESPDPCIFQKSKFQLFKIGCRLRTLFCRVNNICFVQFIFIAFRYKRRINRHLPFPAILIKLLVMYYDLLGATPSVCFMEIFKYDQRDRNRYSRKSYRSSLTLRLSGTSQFSSVIHVLTNVSNTVIKFNVKS